MIFIGKKAVVTTAHRGVFFGTLDALDREAKTATLSDGRNCLCWTRAVRGFMGLAVTGPGDGCRVGPAVIKIDLYDITSVILCTDDAIDKWESGPWSS